MKDYSKGYDYSEDDVPLGSQLRKDAPSLPSPFHAPVTQGQINAARYYQQVEPMIKQVRQKWWNDVPRYEQFKGMDVERDFSNAVCRVTAALGDLNDPEKISCKDENLASVCFYAKKAIAVGEAYGFKDHMQNVLQKLASVSGVDFSRLQNNQKAMLRERDQKRNGNNAPSSGRA